MKRFLSVVFLLILNVTMGASISCFAGGSRPYETARPYQGSLDIDYCYSYLAPFGSWVELAPYGYVWCPRNTGYLFRPYCDGHWIYSDFGWTWISDYEWGWLPFHYGRWGWDNDFGWYWVPGMVWGPAWATWRWNDLYFGWAPIPPGADFYPETDYDALTLRLPLRSWVFVGGSHFLDRDIRSYALPYERNEMIVGGTRIQASFEFRGGRLVNHGLEPALIQRLTRSEVPRYRLADADRPGGARVVGGEARIFRPSIKENPAAQPAKVLKREDARRELGPVRIFERPAQAGSTASETIVRKKQSKEQDLLAQSQADERKYLERRREEEARAIQDAAGKDKIRRDYETRMAEQRKQHQAEKQQLDQRHRQEAEQVRRAESSRRETPPPPQKKRK